MYKVMVVDDDVNVRVDLKDMFAYSLPDFEIVGDAGDGMDALGKIEKLHPDIVLLDIEMPVMDGLQTLSAIRDKKIACKVVVLSCHDDYRNVRTAMKTGASEYLLKQDMEYGQLSAVMNKIAEEIEHEKAEKNEISSLKVHADVSASAIKANLVLDLMKGYLADSNLIRKRLRLVKMDIPMDNMVVCCLQIEDYYRIHEKYPGLSEGELVFSVENVINDIMQKSGNSIYGKIDGKTHYIILGYSREASYFIINHGVYELISNIGESLMKLLNVGVTCGVSNVFQGYENIVVNACMALQAAESKFYLGKGKILHYSEAEKYNSDIDFKKSQDNIKLLISSIYPNSGIAESPEKIVRDIYNGYKNTYVSIQSIKKFNIEIITNLLKELRKLDIEDEVFGDQGFPYETINGIDTREELENWLSERIRNITGIILQRADQRNFSSEIKKAIEYMENHYDKELNLKNVANHVNLNEAYFSQKFKKETDQNFVDYLSNIRLEKAKSLLATTDLKVYDVAAMVGVDNYSYFTKIFKKAMRTTPIEYRNGNKK